MFIRNFSPLMNEAGIAPDGGGAAVAEAPSPPQEGAISFKEATDQWKQHREDPLAAERFIQEKVSKSAKPEAKSTAPAKSEVAQESAATEQPAAKTKGKLANIAPAEQPPEVEQPASPPKEQKAWDELRGHEKWRKENEPLLQQYQKELEESKAKLAELAARDTEFNELRQFRAAYDFENTPEFQNEVVKPWKDNYDIIQSAAEYGKIPIDKIFEALNEPNKYDRAEKLREVLSSGGEREVPMSSDQEIIEADNKLRAIQTKRDDLRKNAETIQSQFKTQDEAKRLQAEREQERIFQSSIQEVNDTFKVRLKGDISEDMTDFNGNKFTWSDFDSVERATDPNDIIYNEQAGKLLPFFIQQSRELKAQLKAKDKEIAERAAVSNPAVKPTEQRPAQQGTFGTLAEAKAAQREFPGTLR